MASSMSTRRGARSRNAMTAIWITTKTAAPTAWCTAACQINVCGDGKVDSTGTGTHHEDCDDHDRIDTNRCTNDCKISGCGDGILGPGEQCDDGPGDASGPANGPGKRCNASCQFN